jgi:ribosome maturation protein Sdo1
MSLYDSHPAVPMRGKVHPEIGFAFLLTEIETALVFARIALDSSPQETEKIERNRRHAQEAYAATIRYRALVDLDAFQEEEFNAKFQQVTSVLREMAQRRLDPTRAG